MIKLQRELSFPWHLMQPFLNENLITSYSRKSVLFYFIYTRNKEHYNSFKIPDYLSLTYINLCFIISFLFSLYLLAKLAIFTIYTNVLELDSHSNWEWTMQL